jgi:response regulator NasT
MQSAGTHSTPTNGDGPPAGAGRTCLIVEDDLLIREFYVLAVQQFGLSVVATAGAPDDAVRLAEAHRPDTVLMDIRLGDEGRDGVDAALEIVASVHPRLVFITASTDPRTMARAREANPHDILVKPVRIERLRQVLA